MRIFLLTTLLLLSGLLTGFNSEKQVIDGVVYYGDASDLNDDGDVLPPPRPPPVDEPAPYPPPYPPQYPPPYPAPDPNPNPNPDPKPPIWPSPEEPEPEPPMPAPPRPPVRPPAPKPPAPKPPEKFIQYTLGGGDTGRFHKRTMEFSVRADLSKIAKIKVTGIRNTVEVVEVALVYTDGRVSSVLSLKGDYYTGQSREFTATRKPVKILRVTIKNTSAFAKKGAMKVDVISLL